MATTTALLASLEYPAAALSGRPDLARTVLEWAEHSLGPVGEIALMRAQRLTAMGRLPAAAETLRPVLDGSSPVLLPWAVIEAHVLDCHLAVLDGRRDHARAALDRALELTEQMDVLRPLAFGPAEVAELLTGLLGSFDAREPIARRVLRARFALGGGDRRVGLTERERAVLSLLPSQRSFGEIATELTVSHSTVKTHVRAIYSKLGATSRREAVDRPATAVSSPPGRRDLTQRPCAPLGGAAQSSSAADETPGPVGGTAWPAGRRVHPPAGAGEGIGAYVLSPEQRRGDAWRGCGSACSGRPSRPQ
jgi:LuxR family maltose regulon positive regulatory protein